MKNQFGMASLPIRFLTPFPYRPSRRLRNSLRSDILADQKRGLSPFLLTLEGQRRCEAASLGNPRGYAPLVAGRFEASEKGRRERREIGATVGRGNVAFPLQGVRRRLNLQWTLRLFRICVLNSSLHILLPTQIGRCPLKE